MKTICDKWLVPYEPLISQNVLVIWIIYKIRHYCVSSLFEIVAFIHCIPRLLSFFYTFDFLFLWRLRLRCGLYPVDYRTFELSESVVAKANLARLRQYITFLLAWMCSPKVFTCSATDYYESVGLTKDIIDVRSSVFGTHIVPSLQH